MIINIVRMLYFMGKLELYNLQGELSINAFQFG